MKRGWNWATTPFGVVQRGFKGLSDFYGLGNEDLDPGRPFFGNEAPGEGNELARTVRSTARGLGAGFYEALPEMLTPFDLATLPAAAPAQFLRSTGRTGAALYKGARAVEALGGIGFGLEGGADVLQGAREGDLSKIGGGLFRAGIGGMLLHGPHSLEKRLLDEGLHQYPGAIGPDWRPPEEAFALDPTAQPPITDLDVTLAQQAREAQALANDSPVPLGPEAPAPLPPPLAQDFDLATDFTPERGFVAPEEPFGLDPNQAPPVASYEPELAVLARQAQERALPPAAPGLEGQFADLAGRERTAYDPVADTMARGGQPAPPPSEFTLQELSQMAPAQRGVSIANLPPEAPPPGALPPYLQEQAQAAQRVEAAPTDVLPAAAAPTPEVMPGPPPGQAERRLDPGARKRVQEMSDEEKVQALLTDEKTGLANDRAFHDDAHDPNLGGAVASMDMSGLKWFNDTHGHPAGDEIIRAAGNALREELGVKAYRGGRAGDEFWVRGKSAEEVEAASQRVRDRLMNSVVEYTAPDGTVHKWTGLRLDYGVGKDLADADAGLYRARADAVTRGERLDTSLPENRGQRPTGLVDVSAEGRDVPGSGAAPAGAAVEPGAAAAVEPRPEPPAAVAEAAPAVEEPPSTDFDLLTAAEVADPQSLADVTGLSPKAIDRGLDDIRAGRDTPEAAEIRAALEESSAGEREAITAEIEEAAAGKPPNVAFDWLDQQADPAFDRLKKLRDTAFSQADPTLLPDLSLVGARWIRDGVRDFSSFVSKLVGEFGQGVSKIAREIWDGALGLFRRGDQAAAEPAAAAASASPAQAPTTGTAPARPVRPIPPGTEPGGVTPPSAAAPPKSAAPVREDTFSARPSGGEVPNISPEQAAAGGEAFRATEPPAAEGKPSPAAGEPEFDINVARTSPEEWVQQSVGRMVGALPEVFGRGEGGARGPKRGWNEVRLEAVKQGFTDQEIKRAFRQKGGMLNDVELEGAKIASDEITKKASKLWEDAERLRKEGQPGAAADSEILFDQQITNLAALQYAMIGAKSEAARTLALARKLGEGLSPQETVFQQWLRSKQGLSREARAEFAAAFQAKSPDALAAARRKHLTPKFLEKVVEFWKAGLLSGPPTQMVNFASTGLKTSFLDPLVAEVAGGVDKLRNVPAAEREAFVGEGRAMLQGAIRSLDYAFHGDGKGAASGYAGLWPAIKEIASLKYEAGETKRSFFRGVEQGSEFEQAGGAIAGKKGEAVRSFFHLLNAADQFWKRIAENQELYRQAYRSGKKASKTGAELQSHMNDFTARFSDGTLHNMDEIKARMKNAAIKGTFQEPLHGRDILTSAGAAAQHFNQRNPWGAFVLPFVRTPVNIAKAVIRHTPVGLVDALHSRFKKSGTRMSQEQFVERMAQGLVGSTIAGAVYWASKDKGGVDFTGGGPVDPAEKQNLIDTGWQPYSVKIGNRYVSYQRLEPLASIMGMAADLREVDDAKTVSEKLEKMGGLIGENLTNKTFLAGLEGLTSALHDPKRYAGQFIKQLEGSLVPLSGLSRRLAVAVDPVIRESKPFETRGGVPEPFIAGVPFASKMLEARRTPVGEERVRHSSALERFASPFPSTTEVDSPLADLQREFTRIGFVPGQPQPSLKVKGGAEVRLDPAEYRIAQRANADAAKKAARLIRSRYYQDLPQDEQEEALRKVYSESRRITRARLYALGSFKVRAKKAQIEFAQERRAGSAEQG